MCVSLMFLLGALGLLAAFQMNYVMLACMTFRELPDVLRSRLRGRDALGGPV
eukprot:CAMPEP_0172626148 /NCGR_PEP_ID=MMETSP1068-20121228/148308_1 /TAXON_ID=35684 /ORGANISM="Pseudopedinella elastica, Strain CCMP716" /LENGTH=51 /DNA_ID=CAMNT_0013435683 /DNA_START=1 /DNA_END=153 /DNA_ORIENTATION=+